jgi:hypothetical protein
LIKVRPVPEPFFLIKRTWSSSTLLAQSDEAKTKHAPIFTPVSLILQPTEPPLKRNDGADFHPLLAHKNRRERSIDRLRLFFEITINLKKFSHT